MDLKFIRTLEMRTIESGGDQAAATMDKLATAHKGVAQAAATTATVTETAAKSQKSLRDSVDALEKRFNPLIRNQLDYEKVERRLLAAAAAQPELRERANATIQAAARHYDALSQAAAASGKVVVTNANAAGESIGKFERQFSPLIRASQEFEAIKKEMATAVTADPQMQTRANAVIAQARIEYEKVAASVKSVATNTDLAAASVGKFEQQFSPLIRASQQFENIKKEMATAVTADPQLQTRANAVIAQARQEYERVAIAANVAGKASIASGNAMTSSAGGARLARHELINLSRQFQDVGVSLASGQSPLTVLVQQGSQIADVFATSSGTIRGFFTQVASGAARFATSAAGIATGLAGIAGTAGYAAISWTSGQRDIERALSGIGRASGTTREQINQIGAASSSAFGLSTSEATEAATAFAATGKIYTENNAAATLSLKDVARAMGTDVPGATKIMTKALLDPAQGILDFNEKLGSVDAAAIDYVRHLKSVGDMQGAQSAMLTAINPKIKEMAGHTSTLWTYWDLASNAVSNYFTNLGRQTAQGKIAPGITLGGGTQDEQLATAKSTLETRRARQAQGGPLFQGPMAQAGIRAAEQEVRRLEDAYTDLQVSMRQVRFDKFENDAAAITKAVIPQIEQLQKIREALSILNQAQANKQVTLDQFGPARVEDTPAQQSLQLQERTLGDAIDKQQRLTAEVLKTAESYKGMSVEAALVLDKQQHQLAIASAVTVQERLAAQEQATINSSRLEGLSMAERIRVAAGERAIAEAQISSEMARQIDNQSGQLRVAQQVTQADRMRMQEQVTILDLLRQNVPIMQAITFAANQRAIAEAQVKVALEQQIKSLEDQHQLIEARENGTTAAVKAEQAYRKVIEAGGGAMKAGQIAALVERNELAQEGIQAEREGQQALASAANAASQRTQQANQQAQEFNRRWHANKQLFEEMAEKIKFVAGFTNSFSPESGNLEQFRSSSTKMWTKEDGSFSQFNPAGYTSTVQNLIPGNVTNAQQRFGAGGVDENLQATQQGLATYANKILSSTGSLVAAINHINTLKPAMVSDDVRSQFLGQLFQRLETSDPTAAISAIEQELARLRSQPMTLARLDLIESLNGQLESLRQSTDSLNSTMGSMLSPFFSQDPRTTKLGFRAGVVGNPDWFKGGSNDNPMTAITGAGSVAAQTYASYIGPDGKLKSGIPGITGFATGGSFIVPGGTSVTDNMMAQFPVASGEEIVVNRNPEGKQDNRPIIQNFDNRIVIEGSVDAATLNKLKMSQYQHAQRMKQALG